MQGARVLKPSQDFPPTACWIGVELIFKCPNNVLQWRSQGTKMIKEVLVQR
jgi:hypothetical protein